MSPQRRIFKLLQRGDVEGAVRAIAILPALLADVQALFGELYYFDIEGDLAEAYVSTAVSPAAGFVYPLCAGNVPLRWLARCVRRPARAREIVRVLSQATVRCLCWRHRCSVSVLWRVGVRMHLRRGKTLVTIGH